MELLLSRLNGLKSGGEGWTEGRVDGSGDWLDGREGGEDADDFKIVCPRGRGFDELQDNCDDFRGVGSNSVGEIGQGGLVGGSGEGGDGCPIDIKLSRRIFGMS